MSDSPDAHRVLVVDDEPNIAEPAGVRGPGARRGRARGLARGLPTDEPGALFERFWRAEGGRERALTGRVEA